MTSTTISPMRTARADLATGVALHYVEQGDPSGRPVILLHGYSDASLSFAPILPLLPPHLHLFALDQRGHGESDRPLAGYTMRDLAADVIAFMDALGLARATVVGHSMGSFVAQQVALAAPTRVERLVLIGTGTAARNFAGVHELPAVLASFDAHPDDLVPETFVREFQESTLFQPVPPAFLDAVVATSRKLPLHAWRALIDGMLATDAPTGLAEHRIPTLVLWGEQDAFALRAEQHALLALLGAPATLRTYPDLGHSPHWERPEAVAGDLVDFLGGE